MYQPIETVAATFVFLKSRNCCQSVATPPPCERRGNEGIEISSCEARLSACERDIETFHRRFARYAIDMQRSTAAEMEAQEANGAK